MLSRRELLATGAGGLAMIPLAPAVRVGFAAEGAARDVLVVVFLHGGADGLHLLAPVDDPDYVAARARDLRLAEGGADAGLRLDAEGADRDFRFHPRAAPLRELFQSGDLAAVVASGLMHGSRSHFECQAMMDHGTPAPNWGHVASGWLARHLEVMANTEDLAAVAPASIPPRSLDGGPATAIPKLEEYGVWADESLVEALRKLGQGPGPARRAIQRTLASIDRVQAALPHDAAGEALAYGPETAGVYGEHPFGHALAVVARLVKLDLGLEVAAVDLDGWDTHTGQSWRMNELVDQLARGLAAFYGDLAAHHRRLSVVVMSEFGRRLRANQSWGTDHGHGNHMFVLGGNVNGGRLHGTWPGLATNALDRGVDLAVTTDYRTVLAEVLMRRAGNPRIGYVFPTLAEYAPLGVMRGEDRAPSFEFSPA